MSAAKSATLTAQAANAAAHGQLTTTRSDAGYTVFINEAAASPESPVIRAAIAASLIVACLGGSAAAQTAPLLLPPPPPVPFTPAGQALSGAFNAINRASVIDPSAALRADFAYRSALARLQMGDSWGAATDAARAQGIAGSAGIGTSIPVLAPFGVAREGGAVPPAAQIPRATAALPDYILAARDRIWQAQDRGADTRAAAKHLRNAIDAYLDGNVPRSQQEARAATQALASKR